MMKFYGASICGDCLEAQKLFKEKGFTAFEYVDITESTANLREFLALRDHRAEMEEARKVGFIGIPCFLEEDGFLTLDPVEAMSRAKS